MFSCQSVAPDARVGTVPLLPARTKLAAPLTEQSCSTTYLVTQPERFQIVLSVIHLNVF
jgi:hypothetical protein